MSVSVEPNTLTDTLQWEVSQEFTREVITLLIGTNYKVGAVLGQVTASEKYGLYDNTAIDGTEVAVAILILDKDASLSDMPGVILARGPAILKDSGLFWNGQDQAAIDSGLSDLKKLNLITRVGV